MRGKGEEGEQEEEGEQQGEEQQEEQQEQPDLAVPGVLLVEELLHRARVVLSLHLLGLLLVLHLHTHTHTHTRAFVLPPPRGPGQLQVSGDVVQQVSVDVIRCSAACWRAAGAPAAAGWAGRSPRPAPGGTCTSPARHDTGHTPG